MVAIVAPNPTGEPPASSKPQFSAIRGRSSRLDTRGKTLSGDDVGGQVVLDDRDLVLEPQLALLEPRDLQLIVGVGSAERGDRRIEIAVLDAQAGQPLAHFLFGHGVPKIQGSKRCIAPYDRFGAVGV